MKKMFLSVFLPLWSVELSRLRLKERESSVQNKENLSNQTSSQNFSPGYAPEGKVLLLTAAKAGKEIVLRCCPKAKRLGVSTGMNLSNAKALTENFYCLAFEPEHEEKMLKSLARWAIRFSPVVSIDRNPEDPKHKKSFSINDPRFSGLLLDVTGEERLFSGYDSLIKKLSAELAALGFCSRLAIAPSYGGAWALSRYGSKSSFFVKNKTALRSALAALPVSALRLSRKTSQSLAEVNISRIEHLYKIPFSSLSERFDYELINRMDEALGKKKEGFTTVRVKEAETRKCVFSGPQKSLEALTGSVEKLGKEVIEIFKEKQQKIAVLNIKVEAQGVSQSEKNFSLTSGTLNIDHVKKITLPWLENLQMGEGITEVTLEIKKTSAVKSSCDDYIFKKQNNAPRNMKELSELIDNLSYALGAKNIRELLCKESFIPEEQFSFEKYQNPKKKDPKARLLRAKRPSKLFTHPQPASAIALLPDKPPSKITWKNETHLIKNGIGPERISSEWWKNNKKIPERDYFKVQIPSGLWIWIYREINTASKHQWFVHGVWS